MHEYFSCMHIFHACIFFMHAYLSCMHAFIFLREEKYAGMRVKTLKWNT